MTMLSIQGGVPLHGSVQISGAKNAALPLLVASLLTESPLNFKGIPHLRDVSTMIELLGHLGSKISLSENMELTISTPEITSHETPDELVSAMRASFLVLGPLLARCHRAKVALPGGCAIGARPVHVHLAGLEAMGASISIEQGFICATAPGGLKGVDFEIEPVSVTGTENLLMAAVLAKGVTRLRNAAKEPEVVDLADCLMQMGAKISGAGTDCIEIEGTDSLGGTVHQILPDRIEAGTYLLAGACTKGAVRVEGISPHVLTCVLEKIDQVGGLLSTGTDWVSLDMQGELPKAVDVSTGAYPSFPTDLQPQWMALNSIAQGQSKITETVFENRFMHVQELERLGAYIEVRDHTAICQGSSVLSGAKVSATDLRAGAALILAGLSASGETLIQRMDYVDRGYEHIEEKLLRLGARVKRIGV